MAESLELLTESHQSQLNENDSIFYGGIQWNIENVIYYSFDM